MDYNIKGIGNYRAVFVAAFMTIAVLSLPVRVSAGVIPKDLPTIEALIALHKAVKKDEDKAMQRALLQWSRPEKRALVVEALEEAGRTDLIGYGPQCLLRPERPHREGHSAPAKAPQRAGKSHAKGAPSSPRNRQKPSGRPGKKRR